MTKIGNLIGAAVAAGALVLGLAACDNTKGTVLNVYNAEVTKATMKCWDGAWSLSVDTGGGEQGIKRVCASQADAAKYKIGDPYP